MPGEKLEVVIVGSINVDQRILVERHPKPGETLPGREVVYTPGGKGANQAAAAALSGARVGMIGAVGSDSAAGLALSILDSAGVELDRVARVDGVTGLAIVAVDERGENSIILAAGANASMTVDQVDRAEAELRDAAVVLAQGEIPVAVTERAAELTGGRFVLNLAPVIEVAPATVRRADPLVVNEHEGSLVLALLGGEVAGDEEETVRALVAEGVRSVVMTLGSEGALVADGDTDPVRVPSAPVDVVDTTGAGDAFVGALAAELAHGVDLLAASRWATRVAAFACSRSGAQASYPGPGDALPEIPDTV